MLDLPVSSFTSMLSCHCIGIDIIACFFFVFGVWSGLREGILVTQYEKYE